MSVGVKVEPAAVAAKDGGGISLRSWGVIGLLMLIGVINYLDRVLPAILAEPLKRDLSLSDSALGLINGVLFLAVYATFCIPIARMSDRGAYRGVIAGSVAVWSVMTAMGGWVVSGWQFAATRVGVAFGEAGGTPAAHAYISRNIPTRLRATALSVYTLCLPLGAMVGFVVGGYAGEHLGWRMTFVLMGVIGLLLAAAAYAVLVRSGARAIASVAAAPEQSGPPPPLGPLFRKRSLLAALAGTSFIGMAGYTAMTFTPSFLMRSHGVSLSEAGLLYGVGGGVAAIVLMLAVGLVADRLARRDSRWLLGCVVLLIACALPFSFMSFSTSHLAWAVFGLSLNHGVAIAYAAPVFSALHRLAPLALRARASALVLLSTSILGGMGPVIAGALSDALQPRFGADSLGRALMIVPIAYVGAALCYALALRHFKNEEEPE